MRSRNSTLICYEWIIYSILRAWSDEASAESLKRRICAEEELILQTWIASSGRWLCLRTAASTHNASLNNVWRSSPTCEALGSCLSGQGLHLPLVAPTSYTRKIGTLLNCSGSVEFFSANTPTDVFVQLFLSSAAPEWVTATSKLSDMLRCVHQYNKPSRREAGIAPLTTAATAKALGKIAASCAWSFSFVGFLGSWFIALPVLLCDEFYIFLLPEFAFTLLLSQLVTLSLCLHGLTLTVFLRRPCAPGSSLRLSVLVSWVNPGLWLLPPPPPPTGWAFTHICAFSISITALLQGCQLRNTAFTETPCFSFSLAEGC